MTSTTPELAPSSPNSRTLHPPWVGWGSVGSFVSHQREDVCPYVVHLAGRNVTVVIVIESPEGMQRKEYGEWISIDEDIPVAATLTDLEICQARPSNKR
ncbi:hypothetical protein AVEN_228582-1 [Araneus ventricosus]|uniref:Uncharacterized protein n=1 Tax=Araneus ventricosus TaxID=182803 RepID=A0A4Y2FR40_ARAVE|nr:hypothetical protein AVEN_228582-1 [Araneus ventricosus]